MDIIPYHSSWAMTVLILLVISIIYSIMGITSNREFGVIDRKFALYSFIAVEVQILFGIIVYFQSNIVKGGLDNFGGAMRDSNVRLFIMEHPLMMIIGGILISIGFLKLRKLEDSNKKFKTIIIFYSIGLVLLLSRIPWTHWIQE